MDGILVAGAPLLPVGEVGSSDFLYPVMPTGTDHRKR